MLPIDDLGYTHTFVPARDPAAARVTLLLLHGTGGDENDLLPLGAELRPGAARLGVRGDVLENGMPRFFRRFAEGIFDVDDLKMRTEKLARFITAAAEQYRFRDKRLVAVGYSNGANIAASLLLLHPDVLSAAVLFRPMVPFTPDIVRNLARVPVFLAAGSRDPIAGQDQPLQLAAMLESGGADVTVFWHRGGHELGRDDVAAAKAWLAEGAVRKKLAA
jgi:phospholipase/carboxylesterase/glyoxalase family protein